MVSNFSSCSKGLWLDCAFTNLHTLALPKPINNVIRFSLGLLLNIHYIGQRQIFQFYHSCWYQNKGRGRDREEYCKYFVHILFLTQLFFPQNIQNDNRILCQSYKTIELYFTSAWLSLLYLSFEVFTSVVFSTLRFLLQFVFLLFPYWTSRFVYAVFLILLSICTLLYSPCATQKHFHQQKTTYASGLPYGLDV